MAGEACQALGGLSAAFLIVSFLSAAALLTILVPWLICGMRGNGIIEDAEIPKIASHCLGLYLWLTALINT